MNKNLIKFSCLLLLSGCSFFNSKLEKPKIEKLDKFRSDTNNLNDNNINLSQSSWWSKFNDKTLNTLIEKSLANNNNVQIALANISVAEEQLSRVKMSFVPTITLGGVAATGQIFNSDNGLGNTPFYPIIPNPKDNNFNFYSGSIIPNYSLNFLKTFKTKDLAKENIELQKIAKDSIRLAIISQVTTSYFTILAMKQQLEQQNTLISDLTQFVEYAKIQHKYGLVAKSDIQENQEQLEQIKTQTSVIKNNIVQAENSLQVLMNQNPKPLYVNNNFSNLSTKGIIPSGIPSQVLKNRPDIRQAEEQLKLANINIDIAASNFFPTIDITTPLGFFNSNFANLFNPSSDFWSTQIAAYIPILNLGTFALIREKKASYYIAYYNYIQTVKSAFANVDNSFSNYNSVSEVLEHINNYNKIAIINNDLINKKFKLGYISLAETFSSKFTLDNSNLNLTQIKLQQLQSLILIYQALGGGYDYKNTNKISIPNNPIINKKK